MAEDFFWSPVEENGPYGNDDGWEAVESFIKWRSGNKKSSPVEFLYTLIQNWGYPSFDWNELDPDEIYHFIKSSEPSEEEILIRITDLRKMIGNIPDTGQGLLTDEQLKEMALGMDSNLNLRILLGYDNGIIGTAFAQIATEGVLDNDLKHLCSTAIQRQLLPVLLTNYDPIHQEKRKQQLKKMLSVIEQI